MIKEIKKDKKRLFCCETCKHRHVGRCLCVDSENLLCEVTDTYGCEFYCPRKGIDYE